MRIIDTNFTQLDETVVTYSSQKSTFPASNLKHEFRSKVWRSNGNFVIDSTNNKIDFADAVGGSELTATLASGTYTTSALASEIASQMATSGAETYTVTYSNTTGLWTIVSDGPGFELLNNTGTNAATSTLKRVLGFANSDRTGALTYTGSNIAIHTIESVTFDMRTSEEIDSVALLWPKEAGIKLSSSAVVKIEANATDSWAGPAVSQTVSIDNNYEIATHFFTSAQEYRYWRVTIVDPTNANLCVELGAVVLGKGLTIDPPSNGFEFILTDRSRIEQTAYGNEYVDEYPLMMQVEFNYAYMDYTDVQTLENSFRLNGSRKPILLVFDETETVFDKDHFTIYGKYQPEFTLGHVFYNLFESTVVVREVF